MGSWFENETLQEWNLKVQSTFTNILRTGELPKHVAFIMDGNRRYAKNNDLKLSQGHEAGTISLANVIQSSKELGIKFITIYAFSIENFNRKPEEVSLLFSLLVEKLNLYLNGDGRINAKDEAKFKKMVKIRIVGNLTLIPADLLAQLQNFENSTEYDAEDDAMVINVCFCYTSRDEITSSISKSLEQISANEFTKIDIKLIENNFYFKPDVPPVDILIRTSGHTRLSDFLLWQCNESSEIIFLTKLWPEFSNFDYYLILIKWGFCKMVHTRKQQWCGYFHHGKDDNNSKFIDIRNLPKPTNFVSVLGEKSNSDNLQKNIQAGFEVATEAVKKAS